jgi:GT2 family glycosyltransferase
MSTDDRSPFASVIICSKNRHDLLCTAVASVRKSDYPADKFEIVVVEEGEKPLPIESVRYVHLPLKNLGLGYCHNRGVENANGEIIVFTDDDVLVDPAWLRTLIATFRDQDVQGVSGCVRTQRGSAAGETEEILGLPGGGIKVLARSRGHIIPTVHLSTCNLAYRRKIFDEFSFLETSFGKFGGDDWYLGVQVSGKYKTVFNPGAVVHHKPKATASRLVHTYYRRQLTEYLAKRDLHNQSKYRAIFGKMQQCVIFRIAAALSVIGFSGVPGAMLLAIAYYLLSALSVASLWPYVNKKSSFFLYPVIKFITELGILKGELMILFASEIKFNAILDRY